MNRLDANHKTGKIMFVIFSLIFVPVGLFFMVGGLVPHGFLPVPFFIGLACLTVYALVMWMVYSGRGQSLKSLSDEGATRNDGQTFPWSELDYVLYHVQYSRLKTRHLIWVKIFFKNGGVVHCNRNGPSNFRAILSYIDALPCRKKESNVAGIVDLPAS